MHVRIAMKAWNGTLPATDLGEPDQSAIGPMWVEIDGKRYECLIAFDYDVNMPEPMEMVTQDENGDEEHKVVMVPRGSKGFGVLTLQLIATVETVLVDDHGELLTA